MQDRTAGYAVRVKQQLNEGKEQISDLKHQAVGLTEKQEKKIVLKIKRPTGPHQKNDIYMIGISKRKGQRFRKEELVIK